MRLAPALMAMIAVAAVAPSARAEDKLAPRVLVLPF
jgi:hypothetical protein